MRSRFVLALIFAACAALGGSRLDAQAPAATPDENPEGNTGALKSQVETGGSYDAHSGNATRVVNDLHVPGALGVYGLDFTRYWNSVHNDDTNLAAELPMDFGASNWSHSWRWSAVYDEDVADGEIGGVRIWTTSVTITFPDGHATQFKVARTNGGSGYHDPRFGPPYLAAQGEINWPSPGPIVHDQLVDMAVDGSEFWLDRADGGAVHFIGYSPQHVNGGYAWWSYRATEVFDPHGLRTGLTYDTNGNLTRVEQDGNRWLTLTWETLGQVPVSVIARVDTGGDAGSQSVTYDYTPFSQVAGAFYVLSAVHYVTEAGISAIYTYGTCYGDEVEPCVSGSHYPLLKTADDPHYSGAMTKIRYNYRGTACAVNNSLPHPAGYNAWFYFAAEAIAAEKNLETGVVVAQFDSPCYSALRKDYNGIGGWRTLNFGSSDDPDLPNMAGYYLTKVTDFAHTDPPPQGLPFRKQTGPEPGKVWDGRGNLTQFSYDNSGNPSEVDYIDQSNCTYDRINPGGSTNQDLTRIHNQQHHWLFKKKDERNQFTTYTRDGRRQVTRIDYPDTSWEAFVYDNNNPTLNEVVSHTLPSGAIETYVYDATHRLAQEYNSVDYPLDYTDYTYYGPSDHPEWTGWVATVLSGRAGSQGKTFSAKMEYNGRHQVTKVTYPATDSGSDPFVTYTYDNYGNCTSIMDEMGHLRIYTYDSYRRCTSYTEYLNAPAWDGNGTVVSREWDWIYDRVVDGVGYGASAQTSKEWRVQIEPGFNAAGERRMTARWFDVNNRVTLEQTGYIQRPFPALLGDWYPSSDLETHYFSYDENGQKSSYTDPKGRVTTYGYDNRNRLSQTTEYPYPTGTPRITQTQYNAAGDKILVIFPDLKTQQWPDSAYDAFGQPGQFIDERAHVTNLTYWHWGPMKKLATVTTHRSKDGSGTEDQMTSFSYDGMGRPATTLFSALDGTSEVTTYEFGQLKTWKTRKNQTKTITGYDARGRELSHVWSDGTPGIVRQWDNANRLTRISNSFSVIDYQYDDAGQVWWEKDNVTASGGPAQTTYFRYPGGETSRIQYPNGTIIRHEYTARGQLKNVQNGSQQPFVSYTYLADGKVSQETYLNGMQSTFLYDGRGMISSITHQKANQQILAFRQYFRDNRDRITAWKRGTNTSQNPMEDGRGDRYSYDEEGQLKTAVYRALTPEGTPSGAMRSDSFQYDELGNRMGANQVASRGVMNMVRRDNGLNEYLSWANTYDIGNPLHWGSGIFYDDNFGSGWVWPGNGVTMGEGYITASYNALNQPVAMWSMYYQGTSNFVWFGYDPLGRCVKRWIGNSTASTPGYNPATYFYFDGWNLVQEGPNASTTDRIYVHGNRIDEIAASQVDGQWYYHHYDAGGSCILLTNAAGGLQEQYDYDAFGFPYLYTASGTKLDTLHTRFLFTGREWFLDLRIYDFRNRMYQPELGRFLQPDPKEFGAGDYNLYRYCHNDPVNRNDPTGMQEAADDEEILNKEEPQAQRNLIEAEENLHEPTPEEVANQQVQNEVAKETFENIKAQQEAKKAEEEESDLERLLGSNKPGPNDPKPQNDKTTLSDLGKKLDGIKEDWIENARRRTETNLNQRLKDIARDPNSLEPGE